MEALTELPAETLERVHKGARLRIDMRTLRVTINRTPVHLSAMELRMLYILARCRDGIMSKNEIFDALYGDIHPYGENAFYNLLRKVREKFARAHPDARGFIVTIRRKYHSCFYTIYAP